MQKKTTSKIIKKMVTIYEFKVGGSISFLSPVIVLYSINQYKRFVNV